MAKNIAIRVAGSDVIHDVSIESGTTAKNILEAVGLQGFLLSKGPNDPPLGENEVVYSLVDDGSKLWASSPAEAGQ